MCGFNTTTAPRMMIECLPQSKRGVGGLYSNSVAVGVFVAFSLGFLLGDDILSDYWFVILLAPGALVFMRMIIILIFFRFETPVYIYGKIQKLQYNGQIRNYDQNSEINNLKKKAAITMSKFNENPNDVRFEKKLIKENVKLCYSKGEKNIGDLIKTNIFSKDRVFSFLAVMGYMAFTSWSGQTYNDSYSKEIFTNFVDVDFSHQVVFYSGFTVVAGSILGGLILNKVPRRDFILGVYFLQIMCMYFLTMAMYFEWINMAVVCTMAYSFWLYFGLASCYVFPNEVAQPFISGLGYAMNWVSKSICG